MSATSPGAGPTVLVTGGSSGLGAAVVAAVAASGGRPLVLDRQPPVEGVSWTECDLADTRAAEAATRHLAEQAGGLDAVVTAAGMDVPGRLAYVPGETWDRIIAVDLLATAAVIRAALPFLQTSRGRIVTVASTLGVKAVS
ncbi:SDR family oxidoreductase, partial [Micromonospora sp. RHAY321]|uniref:SDR family NAD(P)-dependent oxidoreductase n=1 Tax=Micromonospora sp. RHAY321 TaxID=2944807 RepID=UPI00207D6781